MANKTNFSSPSARIINTPNNNKVSVSIKNKNTHYSISTVDKVETGAKVSIYNLFGSLLYSTTVKSINHIEIDAYNFKSGIYMIRIEEEGKLPSAGKIIVQ